MDPQKNDGSGAPTTDQDATTPNEFKIDGIETPGNDTQVSQPGAAPETPVTDVLTTDPSTQDASTTDVPPESSVAFTTDSSGNVQAVPAAESDTSFQPSADVPPTDTVPTDPAVPTTEEPAVAPLPDGQLTPGVVGDVPAGEGSVVPPAVPVAPSHGDKKTVIILGVVAVLLLGAIAFLFFM